MAQKLHGDPCLACLHLSLELSRPTANTLNLLKVISTICEGYFEKSLSELIEDIKSKQIVPE